MTENSRSPAEVAANNFPWAPILFLAAAAAAWALTRSWPLTWPGLDDAPAHWIGMGFGVAGVILIASAIKSLVGQGTTVRPDRASTVLVKTGPYAQFRNPIYLGEVLLLFFAAELTKSAWYVIAGLGFALLVTVLQVMPEERHLEARFAGAYLEYKSRTRRWI